MLIRGAGNFAKLPSQFIERASRPASELGCIGDCLNR